MRYLCTRLYLKLYLTKGETCSQYLSTKGGSSLNGQVSLSKLFCKHISYTVKFQTYLKTFLYVFPLILFWRIEMIPHFLG